MYRIIVFFCGLFFCFIQANAVQCPKPAEIAIRFENQSLDSALYQLEKECGYKIVYQDTLDNKSVIINQNFAGRPIDRILGSLFTDTNNSYTIIGRYIIIYKKTERADSNQKCTTGTVVDENGESLLGAYVRLKGEDFETVTNSTGNFTVPTTNPYSKLVVEYLGYLPRVVDIKDAGLIKLEPDWEILKEVITIGN